jgi:nickel superoxide dismutase
MKKNTFIAAFTALILGFTMFTTQNIYAHCEIPCGIYADSMRIEIIKEHIRTVEKSMSKIDELSQAGDKNYNQLVRWVVNKEEHAVEIQTIVSEYFLHQRIKVTEPSYAKYDKYIP